MNCLSLQILLSWVMNLHMRNGAQTYESKDISTEKRKLIAEIGRRHYFITRLIARTVRRVLNQAQWLLKFSIHFSSPEEAQKPMLREAAF